MLQEVKDADQSKWYKRMYDTIHKQKRHNGEYFIFLLFHINSALKSVALITLICIFADEYVTVRYKQPRGTNLHQVYGVGLSLLTPD